MVLEWRIMALAVVFVSTLMCSSQVMGSNHVRQLFTFLVVPCLHVFFNGRCAITHCVYRDVSPVPTVPMPIRKTSTKNTQQNPVEDSGDRRCKPSLQRLSDPWEPVSPCCDFPTFYTWK